MHFNFFIILAENQCMMKTIDQVLI